MAMRPKGGTGRPNPEPRLIVGRVYKPFKPMSEWRQEDDYDNLLVYLPGFQKEYIKVTTEDLNIIRVRGERLVAENKWSRFQEDFRVPKNCEMRGVRARFDGGILKITMPRKIITASPPPPTTSTSTSTTTRVPDKSEEPQETLVQKPKEDSKERATSSNAALQTPLDEGSTSTLPPQPQPAPTKQEPSKTAGPEADGEFTFGSKNDGTVEKGKTKEAVVGSQGGKVEENAVVKGGDGWRGLNEDRKMVVNMGVGVLVIVTLGIHVSYTIGLIGKGKY
ncbi:uncharacterized protein LOC112503248 [Cynara cardunculus var. scolymus]|uniref:uncharacterized protein LOC112503248 n=1 Tax=Cynara cardunculus var. scolymus TaxID=59895 RepID=UPI000D626293|nr:uncharacterized protein LOC112503248 [Cynara cardunculus var. scolymus]